MLLTILSNNLIAAGVVLACLIISYLAFKYKYERVRPSDIEVNAAFKSLKKKIPSIMNTPQLYIFDDDVEDFWLEHCSRGNQYAIWCHTQLKILSYRRSKTFGKKYSL